MAKTMTPSEKPITDGQIDKAVEVYRAMLQKHRAELSSEAVQRVLTQGDYVGEQVGVLRRRVEATSEVIVRHVRVNRTQTSQEAIAATGRVQYTDSEVVAEMPVGEGEEVDVHFFPLRRLTSVEDFQKALDERGLVPDPRAVAKANEDDPAFADNHPNATQWVDDNGRHCYAIFVRWSDERDVRVRRSGSDWPAFWWVGGVRK